MRYQDHIIEATRRAASEAFKYARQVPADKLNWKPLDEGRSVLDLCREMAACPQWADMILKGQPMPSFSEEELVEMDKAQAHLTTAELCEAECMKNLETFFETVRTFPDDRLNEKYTLPFDGGQTITMAENMEYPLWNLTYHQGQIAYVQTLYGDRKMYW